MPSARPDAALPAPFLKWAGGKKQLLDVILPQLPERIDTYFEPFIGGGAVFFALARAGRFERAVISDKNPELVNIYTVVRDSVDELQACLHEHQERATDSDWYYHVRSWKTSELSPVERAARLLFLNKTCFNGLYRVNRRGEFNVPFGKYKKPKVLDAARLESASRALESVSIRCADFGEVAVEARKGDAVYFDPPYAPVSATASFNSYHSEGFGPPEQARLVDVYRRCWRRGAAAVLSNSDCPLTRDLYRRLDVVVVKATRAINSAADRRGAVNELLVVGPTSVHESAESSVPNARPLLRESARLAAVTSENMRRPPRGKVGS
ncbi:MAG: DNA adenine methylase [Myxococcota bacterium]